MELHLMIVNTWKVSSLIPKRAHLELQPRFHAKPYRAHFRRPTETICTHYKIADNINRVPWVTLNTSTLVAKILPKIPTKILTVTFGPELLLGTGI